MGRAAAKVCLTQMWLSLHVATYFIKIRPNASHRDCTAKRFKEQREVNDDQRLGAVFLFAFCLGDFRFIGGLGSFIAWSGRFVLCAVISFQEWADWLQWIAGENLRHAWSKRFSNSFDSPRTTVNDWTARTSVKLSSRFQRNEWKKIVSISCEKSYRTELIHILLIRLDSHYQLFEWFVILTTEERFALV